MINFGTSLGILYHRACHTLYTRKMIIGRRNYQLSADTTLRSRVWPSGDVTPRKVRWTCWDFSKKSSWDFCRNTSYIFSNNSAIFFSGDSIGIFAANIPGFSRIHPGVLAGTPKAISTGILWKFASWHSSKKSYYDWLTVITLGEISPVISATILQELILGFVKQLMLWFL